ncbi:MAG: DUF373 family protein [Nitrososphaerota archaeon]|nr:DUF373 family protein [Candidatus Geocrenenecus dongiae]
MSLEPKKLLVLVVDRDNDIKRKTGISTPIVGFEENLKAAQSFALNDPEEADVNAMFGALKIYKELVERFGEENVEIATLAGEEKESIEADVKIMHELESVLKKFPADGVVFVSDGVTDEFVLPIVSSRVPVISVKRLVVRQSESVERTWLLLGRYLKLAFTEPKYSRMFLGIPGVLLTLTGLLYLLNLISPPLILTVVGIVLIFRGFNIDQKIMALYNWFMNFFKMPAYRQLTAFANLVAVILIFLGFYIGYTSSISTLISIYPNPPDPSTYTWWWIDKIPLILGAFLTAGIDIIATAMIISIASIIVYRVLVRDSRFWSAVRSTVLIIWIWALLKRTGILILSTTIGPFEETQIPTLILISVLGVVTMTITLIITRILSRMYSDYFKPRKEKLKEKF